MSTASAHIPRLLLLALLSFALCMLTGCEKMHRDLQVWAKKHSLKKSGTQRQPAATMRGCPEGTEPEGYDKDGKPLWCKAVESSISMAQERYPNGQPMSEMIQNGELLIVVKYYPNGQRKQQTSYLAAEKHGPQIEWFDNGVKKLEVAYRKNTLWGSYTERNKAGKVKVTGFYVDGKKGGVWSEFDNEGRIVSRITWKNDEKTGNAEYFAKSGALVEHGAFLGNSKVGRWIRYYEDGKPRSVGNYKAGLQHGDWLEYDQNGKVLGRSFYKEGKPAKKPQLAAHVESRSKDTLGAPPPRPAPSGRKTARAPRERGPRPFTSPQGWSEL